MTYLPPANGGRVNLTIGGNTAGAGALVSSGTLSLVGGNNVTLSQNGNAITISGGAGGAAGSNTFGMSNLGNTIGTSGVISGSALRFNFAGGNNITLSQSLNASSGTITISAANQTVQTQNVHNMTLSGNTAGVMAQISSGTLTLAGGNNVTLSQNGNAVTISAGVGGGGGIALANSQTTYTSGTANLVVAGGAMTIASTTGQSFNFSVPQTSSLSATGAFSISTNGATVSMGVPAFSAGVSNIGNTSGNTGTASNQIVFAGGNNITLSQSTAAGGNTITISAGAGGGGAVTGSYFDNMLQQVSQPALAFSSISTGMAHRLLLQPLAPGNELFPYAMTASTMLMGFSNSGSSAVSGAHSSSWYVGIYTRVNSTQLSLLNSVSTSYGMAANVGNSASYMGARWLSFHSSQWSSAPGFAQGSRYFFGVMARTAGVMYASVSFAGMHLGNSVQRSGQMAAAASSNTSFNAWHPFMGVHSLTTHTAMPVSIANADINKASVYANFVPQVIFDAGLGPMG